MLRRLSPLALVLAASLAACSRGGDQESASAESTDAEQASATAEAPGAASEASAGGDVMAPITEADFAVYERGLEGEIAAHAAVG